MLTAAAGIALYTFIFAAIWPDLGINLAAEIIGVALTVFVIERIYARREARRLAPVLKMVQRDAQVIFSKTSGLLFHVIESNASVGEVDLLGEVAELSDSRLTPIFERLDCRSYANVASAVSPTGTVTFVVWAQYLPSEVGEIERLCRQYIERYSTLCPPDLLSAVHAVEEGLKPTMMLASRLNSVSGAGRLVSPLGRPCDLLAHELNILRDQLDMPALDATYAERRVAVIAAIHRHPVRSAAAPWRP